jgi:hypothetical protein
MIWPFLMIMKYEGILEGFGKIGENDYKVNLSYL